MSQLDIISEFLKDAPPGEVRDVINDIKVIVGDEGITKTIRSVIKDDITESSEPKFEVVEIPKAAKLSIVSKHNVKGAKFYDSTLNKLFNVQFGDNKAIDVEDLEEDTKSESFTKLATSLKKYVAEHYPTSFQKKLAYDLIQLGEDEYAIVIINTKYNPSNFVNGKWCSFYKYNEKAGHLVGEVLLDFHYYEDGNVRFKTHKTLESEDVEISGVISAIKVLEEKFQKELSATFAKLSDVNFKSLRRQLPVTRAKVTWGRAIGNYRLGKDVVNE